MRRAAIAENLPLNSILDECLSASDPILILLKATKMDPTRMLQTLFSFGEQGILSLFEKFEDRGLSLLDYILFLPDLSSPQKETTDLLASRLLSILIEYFFKAMGRLNQEEFSPIQKKLSLISDTQLVTCLQQFTENKLLQILYQGQFPFLHYIIALRTRIRVSESEEKTKIVSDILARLIPAYFDEDTFTTSEGITMTALEKINASGMTAMNKLRFLDQLTKFEFNELIQNSPKDCFLRFFYNLREELSNRKHTITEKRKKRNVNRDGLILNLLAKTSWPATKEKGTYFFSMLQLILYADPQHYPEFETGTSKHTSLVPLARQTLKNQIIAWIIADAPALEELLEKLNTILLLPRAGETTFPIKEIQTNANTARDIFNRLSTITYPPLSEVVSSNVDNEMRKIGNSSADEDALAKKKNQLLADAHKRLLTTYFRFLIKLIRFYIPIEDNDLHELHKQVRQKMLPSNTSEIQALYHEIKQKPTTLREAHYKKWFDYMSTLISGSIDLATPLVLKLAQLFLISPEILYLETDKQGLKSNTPFMNLFEQIAAYNIQAEIDPTEGQRNMRPASVTVYLLKEKLIDLLSTNHFNLNNFILLTGGVIPALRCFSMLYKNAKDQHKEQLISWLMTKFSLHYLKERESLNEEKLESEQEANEEHMSTEEDSCPYIQTEEKALIEHFLESLQGKEHDLKVIKEVIYIVQSGILMAPLLSAQTDVIARAFKENFLTTLCNQSLYPEREQTFAILSDIENASSPLRAFVRVDTNQQSNHKIWRLLTKLVEKFGAPAMDFKNGNNTRRNKSESQIYNSGLWSSRSSSYSGASSSSSYHSPI